MHTLINQNTIINTQKQNIMQNTNNLQETITNAINQVINKQISLTNHNHYYSNQDRSEHNLWVLELKLTEQDENLDNIAIQALADLETTLPRTIAQITNSPLITSPSPSNYLIPNYEPDCFIPYIIFNKCFLFTLQETDHCLYINLTEYEY